MTLGSVGFKLSPFGQYSNQVQKFLNGDENRTELAQAVIQRIQSSVQDRSESVSLEFKPAAVGRCDDRGRTCAR